MSPFLSGLLGAAVGVLLLAAGAAVLRLLHSRRRHRLGFGHRRGLGFLFRRLGTRPEQEEILTREADALAAELRLFRGDARALRDELAELLSEPSLDSGAVAAVLERPFARAREVRARVEAAILRMHETLEPDQRVRLAGMVRAGAHGRYHRA